MKPAPFTYHAPTTVADAVTLLAQLSSEDGRVIAGGQSLLPMMAFRLARPRHLIDINRIPELHSLTVGDRWLEIGATVRHNALERPAAGSGQLGRLLAEISRNVAHPPIRSRGTFCGSIANSDPASEWCLASITTDAEIVIQNVRESRTIRAGDFYTGIMTNELGSDDLVVRVKIRLLPDDSRFGFHEVSRRAGDFAMAAALVVYHVADGRITEPRIGIGGVEPHPRRLAVAEAALAGAVPRLDSFRRAAQVARDAVDPIEDEQTSASYRRELVEAVIQRALEKSLP